MNKLLTILGYFIINFIITTFGIFIAFIIGWVTVNNSMLLIFLCAALSLFTAIGMNKSDRNSARTQ